MARQPDDGANLKQVPEEVRIRFNEPVEAEFSPLEVYNSEGRRVDRADAGVDPDNPRVVRTSLEDLSEGTYTVAVPDHLPRRPRRRRRVRLQGGSQRCGRRASG